MGTSPNHWNKGWLLIIFVIPLALALMVPFFSPHASMESALFFILLYGFIRFAAGLPIYLIIVYLVRELIKHFRNRA